MKYLLIIVLCGAWGVLCGVNGIKSQRSTKEFLFVVVPCVLIGALITLMVP